MCRMRGQCWRLMLIHFMWVLLRTRDILDKNITIRIRNFHKCHSMHLVIIRSRVRFSIISDCKLGCRFRKLREQCPVGCWHSWVLLLPLKGLPLVTVIEIVAWLLAVIT